MSKSVPVRLTLAQVRHLKALVDANAREGSYFGDRNHWLRRTQWLKVKLAEADRRIQGRLRPKWDPNEEEGSEHAVQESR